MKRKVFLATMIFILTISISQAQSWQWGRNGGGSVSAGAGDNSILDMKSDNEGNMYILGLVTRTSARFMEDTIIVNGPDDLLLYKLDCNGNKVWKKQIGDMGATDGTQYLVLDKNGNVYVVGFSDPANSHPYLVDLDTTFTPSMTERFQSNIIKFDKNGNYKYYKTNQIPNAIGYLFAYLKPTMGEDNYLYILTNIKGHIGFLSRSDTTKQQYYILKYDTNAILQSYFPITDSGTFYSSSQNLTSDDNGTIYISGYTAASSPGDKITISTGHQVTASKTFLCNFDTSGAFKWITINDDQVTGITDIQYNKNLKTLFATGFGGGQYIAGDTGTRYGSIRIENYIYNASSPIVLAFDTTGNCVNGNIVGMRYPGPGFSIDVSNVNHILIGGRAVGHTSIGSDTFNTNGQDGFYAELNSDLEFIGGSTLNGNGFYDQVTKVAYDERGNIYVGGYMAGDLYLPGDTLRKIPGGNSNLFIAKYGVPTCTCPYAVANYTDAFTSSLKYTFTSSASNADTIWWEFGDGNTQSGGTTATHTYATAGNYTVCQHVSNVCSDDEFCKSVSVVTGINEVKESYSAIIYPNPASTSIHIHMQGGDLPENSEYVLFDIAGKQILNGKINGNDTCITLSSAVTDGVYLLQINDSKGLMLMSKRVEVAR